MLGGAGQTGSCAVRALAESADVSEGLVADLDEEKARGVADALGRGKFGSAKVDVRNVTETARLIEGYDVVINGVQYYWNLQVMSAALNARVNYLDFGGLFHTTLKQLRLDREFRSRNLVALLGMGGQPGISNVLARHAADSLDRVTSIRIRDGTRDLTKNPPPFVVTWSLETFLDELTMDAPVFENGKLRSVPALSRRETVEFPEPVGSLETFVTIHSEVATFPDSFRDKGLKNTDWMEGVPGIQALKLLVDLGLSSTDEVEVSGQRVVPRRFLMGLIKSRKMVGYPKRVVPNDWEATRLVVVGRKRGTEVELRYDVTIPPRKDWRMSCAQYGVGIPASIVARMIGNGGIKTRGAVPPESCVDPKPFVEGLKKYGMKVEISKTVR